MWSAVRNTLVVLFCIGVLIALTIPAIQRARDAARVTQSKNNLKLIGLAFHNYHDAHRVLPPGAVEDANGKAFYGWRTFLWGYLDANPYYGRLDYDYPWNDPYNIPIHRFANHVYLNPGIDQVLDDDGWPVSHYSANSRVFFENSSHSLFRRDDEPRELILAGEIREGFRAWGFPQAWRDPARGLNNGRETFGAPSGDGAHLLLSDGSVRHFASDTDPDLLIELSTPSPRLEPSDARGGGEESAD